MACAASSIVDRHPWDHGHLKCFDTSGVLYFRGSLVSLGSGIVFRVYILIYYTDTEIAN